ncbi:DUF397 domain-containing protein [Umezawaea beigongshangensis]|uniref:DUF397 domain-containing protein n=1 Tax=Umezawaea beigongshangensis TaxID=2780383 RepID=UPI0018F1BA44|nr:DUF397 domain-containing protein [Umezawaea beigongshangensis]
MTRAWRTSSYSGTGQENCVEVAFGGDVGVRDSKNPVADLAFSAEAWLGFLNAQLGVPERSTRGARTLNSRNCAWGSRD